MADFGALSKLTKKADAVATSASVLVSRSIREIRGELSNLSRELNLAGSADDRNTAYQMVRAKMNRLGRQLNRLMVAQNELAAKTAAQSASKMTGLEIKYSAKRAQAVCEMVTPAQGENLAAVFTDKMGAQIIGSLREATVAALREQAVAGGSLKGTAAAMRDKWFDAVKDGVPRFVDSSGHEWNTATYFQMNVRTNSMRVYNDCLIDDVARETGSDVMRISTGGSDPNCECAAWEGTLISLTGKTPGLPTYDDAKAGGCFHPNCVHTLEVVDEYADADEIKRAQAHPFDKPDDDADIWEVQDNRKYEIDQAVKMDGQGMTQDEARVAVDRDNLAASIRAGLIRSDAESIVAKMTDAQVSALCPDGNPPEFVPFKPTKTELAEGAKEKWNHGKWGGVVHIDAKATAEDILKVCKVGEQANTPKPPKTNEKKPTATPSKPDEWKPVTEQERNTDALMKALGVAHTSKPIDLKSVNPEYQLSYDATYSFDKDKRNAARAELKKRGLRNDAFTYNCQRCVPTWEATRRGYPVTVCPYDADSNGPNLANGRFVTSMWKDEQRVSFHNTAQKPFRKNVEEQMAAWGDGARAEVRVAWKGANGSGHVFVAEQVNGKTVFIDPQSGKTDYNPFDRIVTRGYWADSHWLLRMDTNQFTDVAKRCFKATGKA